MNTTHGTNRFRGVAVGIWTFIIALALVHPILAQDKAPPAPERVGVYDSRAIAVAYVGSAAQVKKMKELTARMEKARETGDTNEISRVEMEGRTWQSKLERQGFGTDPVDDLLIHIANDVSMIQETTGVTRIISKWNKTELGRHPRAVRVDVTMQLVDAFQPNATQRQRAIEIQKTKPVKIKE